MQMDFELPDEIAEFREVTRQIVNGLLVHERAFHETGKGSHRAQDAGRERLFRHGPAEEYGGLGLCAGAGGGADRTGAPSSQFWTELRPLMGPGAKNIIHHGSEAQKARLLPGMATARSASPLP
jgi:acyl-CoA dehydrogenase